MNWWHTPLVDEFTCPLSPSLLPFVSVARVVFRVSRSLACVRPVALSASCGSSLVLFPLSPSPPPLPPPLPSPVPPVPPFSPLDPVGPAGAARYQHPTNSAQTRNGDGEGGAGEEGGRNMADERRNEIDDDTSEQERGKTERKGTTRGRGLQLETLASHTTREGHWGSC